MATEVTLDARERTAIEHGSRACRRLRRTGFVPATLYGHGHASRNVAVPSLPLFHALHTEAGLNVLLSLSFGDGSRTLALARELQRHPFRDEILHLDLIEVRLGEKVSAEVPILIIGIPVGVEEGGVLQNQLTSLSVEAPVTAIPSQIELDVSALSIGDSLTVATVEVPEGVEITAEPDTVITLVVPTSVTRGEGEGEEGEGFATESGAGEESGE